MNIVLVQMRLLQRRGTSFRHLFLAGIGYRAGSLIGGPEQMVIPKLAYISNCLPRATINKGGRPRLAETKKLISLRLPEDVIQRWRATGLGWQTRMADRLKHLPK